MEAVPRSSLDSIYIRNHAARYPTPRSIYPHPSAASSRTANFIHLSLSPITTLQLFPPMAFPSLFAFSLPLFLLFLSSSTHNEAVVEALADDSSLQLMTDPMEWPTTTSLYSSSSSYTFGYEVDEDELGEAAKHNRRALFWHRIQYYISYGALSANRVPCPPRSGRSYYTHNCYSARGPVYPYHRGCTAITRCRR